MVFKIVLSYLKIVRISRINIIITNLQEQKIPK
jgi:hypothetical protein